MRRLSLFLPFIAMATASQAQYGTELVVNGGAELGPTGSGGLVSSIPGWTTVGDSFRGAPTVVRYGSGGPFPSATSQGPADRGQSFFAGGPTEQSSILVQSIDLSWAAADIDALRTRVTVSAYLGGTGFPYEVADLNLRLLDASGNLTGGYGFSGPNYVGPGMAYREDAGHIPIGTRKAEVSVMLYDFAIPTDAGWNGSNDAYADNVSMIVTRPVPEPASMLALAGGFAAVLRRKRQR